MGDWPEELKGRRDIKVLLDSVIARRPGLSWQPAILSIYHRSTRRAVEVIVADHILTLRIPPEFLPEAEAQRVIASLSGFNWASFEDHPPRNTPALSKDYRLVETTDAAADVAWIMHVLWKHPRATPLHWSSQ